MRRFWAGALLCAAVGIAVPAPTQTTAARATDNLPKDLNVLFWSQDQRDTAFRTMETVPKVVVHTIKAGGRAYPMPQGKPIDLGLDVDAHMAAQRNAGLMEKANEAIKAAKRWQKKHDALAKKVAT